MEIEERFWAKVDWDFSAPDRCWPWTASKMRRGYGQFHIGRNGGEQTVARAHRLAFELEYGPIPEVNEHGEPVHIDHTCHDPAECRTGERCPHRACCNPSHLRLTTNRDNHRPDRVASRRAGPKPPPRSKAEVSALQAELRREWWASLTPARRAEVVAAGRKARWG